MNRQNVVYISIKLGGIKMNVVKINMRIFIIQKVVMLQDYWKDLQKEFNVDVEFKILSDKKYWDIILNELKEDKTSEDDIASVVMFIKKNVERMDKTIMSTEYLVSEEVNGFTHIEGLVVLMRFLMLKNYYFQNLNNPDVDKNLKMILRHEMGHVLDILSYEGMEFSKYKRMMNERRVERNRILDEAKKIQT